MSSQRSDTEKTILIEEGIREGIREGTIILIGESITKWLNAMKLLISVYSNK